MDLATLMGSLSVRGERPADILIREGAAIREAIQRDDVARLHSLLEDYLCAMAVHHTPGVTDYNIARHRVRMLVRATLDSRPHPPSRDTLRCLEACGVLVETDRSMTGPEGMDDDDAAARSSAPSSLASTS